LASNIPRSWQPMRLRRGSGAAGPTSEPPVPGGAGGSMPLPTGEKQAVIEQFRRGDKNTGSPEVQIAILTARIKQVAAHLRENKGDAHTRRGLVMMVGKRNRLLRYLQRTDRPKYLETIQALGLRK